CDLDHRKLALDGIAAKSQICDLMNRHKTFQLMANLLDCLRRPGGNNGNAREVLGMSDLGNSQTFDVIAASRKKADDASENARLIIDQHAERMGLDVRLAERRGIGRERSGWCIHVATPAPCRRLL